MKCVHAHVITSELPYVQHSCINSLLMTYSHALSWTYVQASVDDGSKVASLHSSSSEAVNPKRSVCVAFMLITYLVFILCCRPSKVLRVHFKVKSIGMVVCSASTSVCILDLYCMFYITHYALCTRSR